MEQSSAQHAGHRLTLPFLRCGCWHSMVSTAQHIGAESAGGYFESNCNNTRPHLTNCSGNLTRGFANPAQ
jgi:hypothetical protein